jgi:hypothetical protein
VTVALASEKALEFFTPIDERDYIGYNGSLGRKGYDESVLAQYHIVDDPKRTATAQDADADPDEPVCLHETVEPDQGAYRLRAVLDTNAESTAVEKTLTPVVIDRDGSYGRKRMRWRPAEPYSCCRHRRIRSH